MSRLGEIKAAVGAARPIWAGVDIIAASPEDMRWLVSEVERLTAERDALAAQVARVESLAERFDSVQEEHLLQDDCQCEMKDCYECGPWHACTHNGPLGRARQIRAALAGSEADTTDTQPTGQECIKVAPDPGHEDEGYSCVTHNCAWDECPTQTEQEADHG